MSLLPPASCPVCGEPLKPGRILCGKTRCFGRYMNAKRSGGRFSLSFFEVTQEAGETTFVSFDLSAKFR